MQKLKAKRDTQNPILIQVDREEVPCLIASPFRFVALLDCCWSFEWPLEIRVLLKVEFTVAFMTHLAPGLGCFEEKLRTLNRWNVEEEVFGAVWIIEIGSGRVRKIQTGLY